MRIDEIVISYELSKNSTTKSDISAYLDSAVKTQYRIKGYPIFSSKQSAQSRGRMMLFVASLDETELLGELSLLRSPYRGGEFLFSEVYFDPEIQGKGLAVPLYKLAIIQYGLTIVSDESQTQGSKSLWNQLARDPKVNVYVWDMEKDTFRDFDPNDPDDAYFDPKEMKALKAEAEEVNKRLTDQYMNGEIDDTEYNQLLTRYINPIHDEMQSMNRAMDARLVATRGNLS